MSKLKKPVPLYEDIRALVLSARQTIARGVDLLQVYTNYEIGCRIVDQEQHGEGRAEYGKDLLNDLSARLTGEFGNGFSVSNLRYMRQFYLSYPGRIAQIRQTLSGELQGQSIHQTLSGEFIKLAVAQTVRSPRSSPPSNAKLNYDFQIDGGTSVVWETAKSDGVLAFMPAREAEQYGTIYDEAGIARESCILYMTRIEFAAALAEHGHTVDDLSAAEKDQLLTATSAALAQLRLCRSQLRLTKHLGNPSAAMPHP